MPFDNTPLETPLPPVNGDLLSRLVLLAFAFGTLCVLAAGLLIDHWPTVAGLRLILWPRTGRGRKWQRTIFRPGRASPPVLSAPSKF